jgi:hypothetical protein
MQNEKHYTIQFVIVAHARVKVGQFEDARMSSTAQQGVLKRDVTIDTHLLAVISVPM